MQVLLIKDLVNLGKRGDVKRVTEGYARNFLFPRNIAVLASPGSLKNLALVKTSWVKKAAKEKEAAQQLAAALSSATIKITKRAGEKGRLFGSVTNSEIVEMIKKDLHIDIDRKLIQSEHIKELGQHDIVVRLAPEVKATVKVVVLPEEAAAQA
jgi:large subunit ribosomal protein L9